MNANPFKAKIMKLVYLEKTTFNINDVTLHSTLILQLY